MNIILPDFEKNIHYKELSFQDGKKKYRYATIKPLSIKWEGIVPRGTKISFYDKNGREWLYMDHSHIIIHNHYNWDGCTPKKHISIFGWVGTPDFKKTALASLIHDVFCQFQDTENFPLSRYDIDKVFKHILNEKKFVLTYPYYMGARLGGLFHKKNLEVYSQIH